MENQKSDLSALYPEAMELFDGNEFAASTFINKWAAKNRAGAILEKDPNQTLARVFGVLAEAMPTEYPCQKWLDTYNGGKKQSWKDLYLEANSKFGGVCAQGSITAAAGIMDAPQSLSNCMVIDGPRDDINDIMRAIADQANLMKVRCGVGICYNGLRPRGADLANAGRRSSGSVSFMHLASETTRIIGQDGRRGATMLTLSVESPDVEEFAMVKRDLTKITGANISIQISDKFMEAVKSKSKFTQQWPIGSETPLIKKDIDAAALFKSIAESNWMCAEPGCLFWDRITENLPAHCYPQFKTVATNPCGEVPLSANDACRLISICLIKYVKNPFTSKCSFDFKLFEKDIRLAMRMLDAVVTAEMEHIDRIIAKRKKDLNGTPSGDMSRFQREIDLWVKIRQSCELGRRCGLGTHGLADCLAQLRLKYDSPEALDMVESIYKFLRDHAYDESVEMAKEYGPFPVFNWELEKNCAFIKRLPTDLQEKIKKHGRRNISMLTNAPTGTVSIMSQCSSGIEPTFRQVYLRRRKVNPNDVNVRVDFVDALGDKWMHFPQFEKNVVRYFNAIGEEIPEGIKSDADLDKYLPEYFVTSDKIDWKKRVELQAVITRYIDHSISSTINLPKDTTKELVEELYMYAWEKGLKGVTVYRDGCRSGVLVTNESANTPSNTGDSRPATVLRNQAPKRPDKLPCEVHFTKVKGQDYVVIVGLLQGNVYEIFFGKYGNQIPHRQFTGFVEKKGRGKYLLTYIEDVEIKQIDINKYFDNEEYASATRLISMSLRHGVPLEYVLDQLQKSSSIVEFGSAVSRVLKKYIKLEDLKRHYGKCKSCGSSNLEVRNEDGCIKMTCLDCSTVDSKCG